MRRELKKLEAKEARLLDSLGEGVISNSAFKRATDPLLRQIASLRQELASQSFDVLNIDSAVGYLQRMFWNPLRLWETNNLEQKSSLLRLLFPAGVAFNSGVLEPKSTHSFFMHLSDENVGEIELASLSGIGLNQLGLILAQAELRRGPREALLARFNRATRSKTRETNTTRIDPFETPNPIESANDLALLASAIKCDIAQEQRHVFAMG